LLSNFGNRGICWGYRWCPRVRGRATGEDGTRLSVRFAV